MRLSLGLALLTWALAGALRLRALPQTVVGSDSLGPYLKAWALRPEALLAGHLPRPPNPESGDLLWLCALPLVHLASSLEQLFALRFLAGALVAPLGLLAAWVFAAPPGTRGRALLGLGHRRQWVAGLGAGLLLAVDPGLADSLASGARGYGAPEWLALATLGLAFAGRGSRAGLSLAAAAFLVALDHHPLALGFGAAMLLALPAALRRHGPRPVLLALALAAPLGLPRLLRLVGILRCGQDPLSCLRAVAQSNVHPEDGRLAVLAEALHDRFRVDLDDPTLALLALGLLLGPRRTAARQALAALAGLLLVAALNQYLQGYHLRLLAAPLAVGAALGLARLGSFAPLLLALPLLTLGPEVPAGPDSGALRRHDELARRLVEEPGPLWVDRLWWRGQPVLDPSGVVLAALLQGQPGERFRVGGGRLHLLVVGEAPGAGEDAGPGEVLASGRAAETAWSLRRVGRGEARSWASAGPPVQTGGAWDWVVAVQPGREDSEAARW